MCTVFLGSIFFKYIQSLEHYGIWSEDCTLFELQNLPWTTHDSFTQERCTLFDKAYKASLYKK